MFFVVKHKAVYYEEYFKNPMYENTLSIIEIEKSNSEVKLIHKLEEMKGSYIGRNNSYVIVSSHIIFKTNTEDFAYCFKEGYKFKESELEEES